MGSYVPRKRVNTNHEDYSNHQLGNNDTTSHSSYDQHASVSQRNKILRRKIKERGKDFSKNSKSS